MQYLFIGKEKFLNRQFYLSAFELDLKAEAHNALKTKKRETNTFKP